MFAAHLGEAGRAHPADTVGAGVVEAAARPDQHAEAHQEAGCVLAPLVVDQLVIDDEHAALWKNGVGLHLTVRMAVVRAACCI